jgi:hypothetical protein
MFFNCLRQESVRPEFRPAERRKRKQQQLASSLFV